MNERDLTVYDLPIAELARRVRRASAVVRAARDHTGRVGGLHAIDAALDEVGRLLPALMERPRGALPRAMRSLEPHERAALRRALSAEPRDPVLLGRMLGEVEPDDADDALTRVELVESVTRELMDLLRIFERAYCAPVLLG
jgi:hypothetical protein